MTDSTNEIHPLPVKTATEEKVERKILSQGLLTSWLLEAVNSTRYFLVAANNIIGRSTANHQCPVNGCVRVLMQAIRLCKERLYVWLVAGEWGVPWNDLLHPNRITVPYVRWLSIDRNFKFNFYTFELCHVQRLTRSSNDNLIDFVMAQSFTSQFGTTFWKGSLISLSLINLCWLLRFVTASPFYHVLTPICWLCSFLIPRSSHPIWQKMLRDMHRPLYFKLILPIRSYLRGPRIQSMYCLEGFSALLWPQRGN